MVLYSVLFFGEKYDEWCKIECKEVCVVVGVCFVVFVLFENFGIIIIDEEYEVSYK